MYHLKYLLAFYIVPQDALTKVVLAQKRKVLCLHGGGGTGEEFNQYLSFNEESLANVLGFDDYEFYYPDGGYKSEDGDGYLWVPDPPSKDEPTSDPDIAQDSVTRLNQIIQENGPFYGILGYSQGSMFTTYYLSISPLNTFEVAIMFAGYLPLTHLGLLESIENATPISGVQALIWAGGNDPFYDLTVEQPTKFLDPVYVENPNGGHIVPDATDPTFATVVEFIQSPGTVTSTPTVAPNTEEGDDDKNTDSDDKFNDEEKPAGSFFLAFWSLVKICF